MKKMLFFLPVCLFLFTGCANVMCGYKSIPLIRLECGGHVAIDIELELDFIRNKETMSPSKNKE